MRLVRGNVGDIYNADVDAQMLEKAKNYAEASNCKTCLGFVELASAYAVPPEVAYEKRIKHFNKAIDVFSQAKEPEWRALSQAFKGQFYYQIGERENGMSYLESSLVDSALLPHQVMAELYDEKAYESWRRGRYVKAGVYWVHCINYLESADSQQLQNGYYQFFPGYILSQSRQLADAYGNFGLCKRRTGLLDDAMLAFKQSYKIYAHSESFDGQSWMLQMLAELSNDLDNPEEAYNYATKAVDLAATKGGNEYLKVWLSYYETLKLSLEFYISNNKANEFIQNANNCIDASRSLAMNDSLVIFATGILQIEKAWAFQYLNNKDSAVACVERGFGIISRNPVYFTDLIMVKSETINHMLMGHTTLAWAKPNEIEHKQKVSALLNDLPEDLSDRAILRVADYSRFFGEKERALDLYNKLYERIEPTNYTLLKRRLCKLRSEVLDELGRSEGAFEMLKLYNLYSDTINRLSHHSALARTKAGFEQEIGEMRKAELELVNEKLNAEALLRRQTLVGGLISIAILLLAFLFYRRYRLGKSQLLKTELENAELINKQLESEKNERLQILKRQSAEAELREKERAVIETERMLDKERAERLRLELLQKERELSGYSLQHIKHQHELEELKEKLKSAMETTADSKAIDRHFKSIELADNWDEFQMRMQKVHPAFTKELVDKHPSLTPNERKLCALIRMNITTKQISALLNNSPESVIKARYRLRKKMELDKNQDLLVYLENLTE
ncbi:MAG: hypothetical protein KDC92_02545 [Bacteroidetes bacterium]|nr:hypothetical protein [Bacteroidota bacterium]